MRWFLAGISVVLVVCVLTSLFLRINRLSEPWWERTQRQIEDLPSTTTNRSSDDGQQ